MLKPRESASAIGIRKFAEPHAVWPLLEELGEAASHHLVECFVSGEIYHVEGLSWEGELQFALGHKYGQPPFETMHAGGIFSTRTLDRASEEARDLLAIHAATLRALGMEAGLRTAILFGRMRMGGSIFWRPRRGWVEPILPRWRRRPVG